MIRHLVLALCPRINVDMLVLGLTPTRSLGQLLAHIHVIERLSVHIVDTILSVGTQDLLKETTERLTTCIAPSFECALRGRDPPCR